MKNKKIIIIILVALIFLNCFFANNYLNELNNVYTLSERGLRYYSALFEEYNVVYNEFILSPDIKSDEFILISKLMHKSYLTFPVQAKSYVIPETMSIVTQELLLLNSENIEQNFEKLENIAVIFDKLNIAFNELVESNKPIKAIDEMLFNSVYDLLNNLLDEVEQLIF